MKKNHRVRIGLISAAVAIISVFFNFSCKNFLSEFARIDIQNSIDYNNAPSYIITVDVVKGSGTMKNLATTELSKKVTDSFTLKFEPADDHKFIKWEAATSVPLVDGDDISNYIEFESPLSTETKVIFKKANSSIIIRPVCPAKISVVSFNMSDSDRTYPRDSSVVLTFNEELSSECLDKISIRIPNLPEGKTFRDYYKAPVKDGKSVIFYANIDWDNVSDADFIPIGKDDSKAVSINFPASEIFYYDSNYSSPIKVTLDKDLNLDYHLNAETSQKTRIQYVLENLDVGNLRIDSETRDGGTTLDYSVGKSINIRYKINDDYTFGGWHFWHIYTNDAGEEEEVEYSLADLADINLSMDFGEYDDDNGFDRISSVVEASVTINNHTDGMIKIVLDVEKIPDVEIQIDGAHGKFSPSKGKYTFKAGVSNHIEFESDSDYAFIRWQLINSVTGEELPRDEISGSYDYIRSFNLDEEKADFEVINVPDENENIKLVLQPLVAERPQVISNTPLNTGLVNKDTTIQVVFDYDMDENSIYYTDDELIELKQSLGIASGEDSVTVDSDYNRTVNKLLFVESGERDKNGNLIKKYYGYERLQYERADKNSAWIQNSTESYYKNIIITNNKTDENITGFYSAPVFENAKTLSINVMRADDNSVQLSKYMQVRVNLDKGFFYSQDGKPVSMGGSKKWIYQVNNETDNEGPAFSEIPVFKINGTSGTGYINRVIPRQENIRGVSGSVIDFTNLDYHKNAKNNNNTVNTKDPFNLSFEINDTETGGSGAGATFTLECTKLYDAYYNPVTSSIVRTVGIDFDYVSGPSASYNGDCKELRNLDSGIYSIRIIARDKCGNQSVYPPDNDPNPNQKWYVVMDKTGPSYAVNDFGHSVPEEEGTILLDYDENRSKDFAKLRLYYARFNSGTNFYGNDLLNINKGSAHKITGLQSGTLYRFDPYFDDYAGNASNPWYYYQYTIPAKPSNVTLSQTYGISVNLTGTNPDNGNFKGIRVRYREKGSSDEWSEAYTAAGTGSTVTRQLSNLPKGKILEFEVCSYDDTTVPSGVYNPKRLDLVPSVRYSLPYKNGSDALPTFATTPNDVTLNSVSVGDTKNKLIVNYTKPTGDFTKIRLIYSTVADFNTSSTVEILKANANGSYTLTGLTAGTKYYVKVEAYLENVYNRSVSEVKTAYTRPNVATNFYADDICTSEVGFCWNKPASGRVDAYEIWARPAGSGDYQLCGEPDDEDSTYWYCGQGYGYDEMEEVTFIPGKKLDARVYTVLYDPENNVTVKSSDYAELNNIQLPPCSAYPVKAVKVSSTSMNLTWSKPSYGEFDGYNVYYSTSSTNLYWGATESELANNTLTKNGVTTTRINITNKNTTSYSLNSLIENGYYYVWVETYVGNYKSPSRAVSSSSTRCSLALEAVTNLSASTATSYPTTGITLSWTCPTNTSAYNGLEIWYKKSTESSYTRKVQYTGSNKTVTSYTITGLSVNTKYDFRVRTYVDSSVYADNEVTRATLSTNVTNLSATSNSSSVTLTWTNPTTANYESLKVYRGSTLVANLSQGTTSYSATGLTAGTQYTFYVKTVNKDGNISLYYPSVTKRTGVAQASGLTTQTTTQTSKTFRWTNPSGNFTGLRFYYRLLSSSTWTAGPVISNNTTTSTTISGLSAGNSYAFKVETYLSADSTEYTNSAEFSTYYTAPPAVTNFKYSSRNNNKLTFTWTNPNSSNYTNVRLWYKTYSASSYSYVDVPKGNTSYELTLTNGYRYYVYAQTYYNNYSADGCKSSMVQQETKPLTPTNFRVNSAAGVVTASWTVPAGEQNYYMVKYRKVGETSWTSNNCWTSGHDSSSTTVSVPNTSDRYEFCVYSQMDFSGFGGCVDSDYSSSVTYYAPPPKITSVTLSTNKSTGKVTITVGNLSSIQDKISSINVFVNGTYKGGIHKNNTSMTLTSTECPNGAKIILVPYHCNNSGHTESTSDTVPGVWSNETYSYPAVINSAYCPVTSSVTQTYNF